MIEADGIIVGFGLNLQLPVRTDKLEDELSTDLGPSMGLFNVNIPDLYYVARSLDSYEYADWYVTIKR
jgi:hypothetical protein